MPLHSQERLGCPDQDFGRTFTITCTPMCGGPLLLLNRHLLV